MNDIGFRLEFDSRETQKHPNGYWYACTNDVLYAAVGTTPETAMANLITVLHRELLEVKAHERR